MSKKLESKRIAIILAGVVILSLLGIAAYSKLSPTGFFELGTVALQVGEVVSLTVTDNSTNLSLSTDTAGDACGYVDPAAPNAIAYLNSEACGAGNASCNSNGWWKNVTGGAARLPAGDWITVNNTGTVNLTLKISATLDAITFFGAGNLEAFFVKVHDSMGGKGACSLTDPNPPARSNGYVAYGEDAGAGANATDTVICSDLLNQDGHDALNLTFNWTIPAGAATAAYNSSLLITATKAAG